MSSRVIALGLFLWSLVLEKIVVFNRTGKLAQQVNQLAFFHGFGESLFFGKEACSEAKSVSFDIETHRFKDGWRGIKGRVTARGLFRGVLRIDIDVNKSAV